jgi:PhnB protein
MEDENTQVIIPYLLLKGAKQFIEFTKSVFDATVSECREREDTNQVMHAELMIKGSMIMVADATDRWIPSTNSLFIWVENADVTYQKAIQNGAESIMELANFETRRISGVKDAFNNIWWITSVLK